MYYYICLTQQNNVKMKMQRFFLSLILSSIAVGDYFAANNWADMLTNPDWDND